jgi:DNA-binding beta-propeller fold protein YncE
VKSLTRLGWAAASAIAVVATAVAAAAPAGAATTHQNAVHRDFEPGARHAVFVQTDNPAGNQVVAYHRNGDGTLSQVATYPTGGLGGVLTGSVTDHLASQGSLAYDPGHGLLYAVNAGSDTVSVFAAYGDRLVLRQVIRSGGDFPVSVAVHGDLVYVLNALKGGAVQGYRVFFGHLLPIPRSNRPLGLDPAATPQFTNTPGQVAFSPDGSQLIVTTKANGNDIDVFAVGLGGRLSASPVVNPEPGTVPFAIDFDPAGHLLIAEAGTNALASFALHADGTVGSLQAVPNGQAATCWVTSARGFFYTSNTGSGTLSGYSDSGGLALLGNTTTDPGTVDAAASPGGGFLYAQTGGQGIVDEFAVNADGSLTAIGSVTVAGAAGGEGIAAA